MVLTVLRKEFKELAANRSMVVMGLVAAVFFSVVFSDGGLEGSLVLTPLLVALSLGYYGSSQVFLREKTDFVVETLLCSPATLRDLWLGKTLGVTLVAAIFAVVIVALTVITAGVRGGASIVPDVAFALYLAAVVPLAVACLVGARGYAQLLFGMRESHLISMALLLVMILILRVLAGGGASVPALTHVAAAALGAGGLLTSLGWCTRFLSMERIVTTL